MFKNIKYLVALPLMALSLTSCNNVSKTLTYNEMREFAADHYDQNALDVIPAIYTANLHTMQANIVVDYVAPTGGSDSFVISFGFNGIHIVVKDRYAVCLSSGVVDSIEQRYSDFAGLAVSIIDEPPVSMSYAVTGGNRSKIDMTTNAKIAGNLTVKLLQLLVGAIDMVSSTAGYLPNDPREIDLITNPVTKLIAQGLVYLLSQTSMGEYYPMVARVMDYLTFTVSNSSKAHGETFDTYITTDSYGFLDVLDFNYKSSFEITGLASFKKYDSDKPTPGDQPSGTDAPYQFTLTGSVDFDFDVDCELVR